MSEDSVQVEVAVDATFPHMDGTLTVSLSTETVVKVAVAGKTAQDLFTEVATAVGSKSGRLVVQYSPGPSGKEAGSGWADVETGEDAASVVLGFVARVEEGFAAGEDFVA